MQTEEKRSLIQASPSCIEWLYGYAFEAGDYACVSKVMYRCKPAPQSQLCKIYSPTSDAGIEAWASTTLAYSPAPAQLSGIDCVKWVAGFVYQEADLVCDAGSVWECKPYPDSKNCGLQRPSSQKGSTGWKQKTNEQPPTSVAIVCTEWTFGGKFKLNDNVCQGFSTFKCLSEYLSTYMPPSYPGTAIVYEKLVVPASPSKCKPWAIGTLYSNGDLACDGGSTWTCIDALTCMVYRPTGSNSKYAWSSSDIPYNPAYTLPVTGIGVNPVLRTFKLGYNYIGGDLVTMTGIDAYRCKAGYLEWTCKSTTPSASVSNSIWEVVTYSGTPTIDLDYILPEIECYDFASATGSSSLQHVYKNDEFACDGGRVWKCRLPSSPQTSAIPNCQTLNPREDTTNTVWTLTRAL